MMNAPILIDTHAHLNHEDFSGDLQHVLDRALQAGVQSVIVPGYDLASSERAVELAEAHERLYATVGVHPHDAKTLDSTTLDRLGALARARKVVAYGEIGLDFHYNFSPPDIQVEAFAVQLRLARELDLPLVIHTREASGEIIDILKREGVGPKGGVMHHFSGEAGLAREALGMGLILGIAGPLTYKKNEEMRETVRSLDLARIVLETDAPYASPQAFRGRRNEPAYVRLVAEKVAELHCASLEQVAARTTANAIGLFGLRTNGI